MTKRQKMLNFMSFINGANAVLVRNATEMQRFVAIMKRFNFEELLYYNSKNKTERESYYYWQHIAAINQRSNDPVWDYQTLYWENQPDKEMACCYAYDKSVDEWYGVPPLTVDDIDDSEPNK